MKMSSATLTDGMRMHLAPGYDEDGKPAKSWDMDEFDGAGAIRSTAARYVALSESQHGSSIVSNRGER